MKKISCDRLVNISNKVFGVIIILFAFIAELNAGLFDLLLQALMVCAIGSLVMVVVMCIVRYMEKKNQTK